MDLLHGVPFLEQLYPDILLHHADHHKSLALVEKEGKILQRFLRLSSDLDPNMPQFH
jgi:hypothetical protein